MVLIQPISQTQNRARFGQTTQALLPGQTDEGRHGQQNTQHQTQGKKKERLDFFMSKRKAIQAGATWEEI
jgi:hypothetical protein